MAIPDNPAGLSIGRAREKIAMRVIALAVLSVCGGVAYAGGIVVTGGGSMAFNDSTLSTDGRGEDAVVADGEGSSVTLNGGVVTTNYRRGPGGGNAGIDTHALLAKNGGDITGSALTISGSNDGYFDGVVSARAGSTITLTDSSVLNTMLYADFSAAGATADGASAVLTLNGTDVSVESNKISVNSSAAAIGVTNGGAVRINAGAPAVALTERNQLIASGDLVKGIIAANGSGNVIDASNIAIATDGRSGYGVQVDAATLGGSSFVNLNNSSIHTSGAAADGVHIASANGGIAQFTGDNLDVVTGQEGAHGVSADGAGSSVSLNGGSITTTGVNAMGLIAQDGASIVAGNAKIITEGRNAHGVAAYTAGRADLIGGSVLTVGNSYGLYATGEGSTITTTDGTTITTNGGKAGVQAEAGATIELNGGAVTNTNTTAGSKGIVAVDEGTTIRATDVAISAAGEYINSGELAVGVSATKGAHIELTRGSIAPVSSQFSRGILAGTSATVNTTDVTITTTGEKSNAVHAFSNRTTEDKPEDTPTITLNGASISTAGDDSYGFSAQNIGARIVASDLSVNTVGENSYGAVAYNGGVLDFTDIDIATQGAGAVGIAINAMSEAQIPGSVPVANVLSSVTMQGGSITTTGADAAGVLVRNDGELTLTGTTINAAGPALISEFTKASQEQTITIGAGSELRQNNGTLLLVNRIEEGSDGTVELNLQSGSFSAGNVLDKDGDKNVTVNKDLNAYWAGIVIDGSTEQVEDGDSKEYTDELIENDIASGEGSSVSFSNGANIDGSVSSGVASTTTFNGPTQISGDVSGQQASNASFSGDTNIGGSVTGATSSTFVFNGPTTNIGGSVAGAEGAAFNFSSPTTIGGNLAGMGAIFSFDKDASTSIAGDVQLGANSSIKGGSTSAPIQITGSAQVAGGSILGGNLNILGEVSGSGSILAPGNSVGTQTYGSFGTFTGTTYVAEVNAAGQSDLIRIASGYADLTGIDLRISQENGSGGYVLNHDYTIVETSKPDGISGVAGNKFASEALDGSFDGTLVKLDAAKFGDNTVKISLSADDAAIDAKRKDLSSNQNATLNGVLSVYGQNAAADAALQSQDSAGALNQLSGEVHASTQSALINTGSLITRTLTNRMRGNLGASMAPGAPLAQSSGSVPAGAMPTSNAYPLWAEVVGSWSSLDGDSNVGKVKSNVGGLFVGGDAEVGGGWRVGGALGFTDGKIEVNDRSSKSDVTSYTAALYGGNSWEASNGKINFLAGAAYTRHDVDSRRTVSVGGNQTLKADYDVNTTQLFTELGYAIPVGHASEAEPYLGVAWLSQKAKGFTESGGSAALRGDSQKDDVTTFTLGLRGKTAVDVGAHSASLFAGLGWRHAAGDVESSRNMGFIQGNGASFKVSGAPIAKNAAVVDLGAEMGVGKNASLGLAYSGQFGNDNTDNTGSLYLKVRF